MKTMKVNVRCIYLEDHHQLLPVKSAGDNTLYIYSCLDEYAPRFGFDGDEGGVSHLGAGLHVVGSGLVGVVYHKV